MVRRALWTAMVAGGVGFAAYMLAFYGLTAARDQWERWNWVLPDLHEVGRHLPTLAIALHFAGGAILVVLGPLQLVPAIRARRPGLHRAMGTAYIAAALGVGLAGNVFIYARGTIGGMPMNVAFSIYGWLLVGAAIMAWRAARARDLVQHRAWALRLFALGLSSMLYRFEYALWTATNGGHMLGHADDWQGPLDLVMDFAFFVPTLVGCELYLRFRDRVVARPGLRRVAIAATAALTLVFAAAVVMVAAGWWWPAARMAAR